MADLEFISGRSDCLLRYDQDENAYIFRQFKGGWYARLLDKTSGIPHIEIDGNYYPLERVDHHADCFAIGKCTESLIETMLGQEFRISSYAGRLTLWSLSNPDKSTELYPSLYVEAGSLEPAEFDEVIQRLGELAFFQSSPFRARETLSVSGNVTEASANESHPDLSLIQGVETFLHLIQQVTNNWSLVRSSASKETQLLAHVIDSQNYHGASSARIALRYSQNPAARRIEVLIPQESFKTPENRFIMFVLLEIRQRSDLFYGILKNRAEQIRLEWAIENEPTHKSHGSPPRFDQYVEAWGLGRQLALCLSVKMTSLADSIKSSKLTIRALIDEPFLRQVRNTPAIPSQPSDRLTQSVAYRPIYKAFCNYQKFKAVAFVPLKSGLLRALTTKAIHPARTLYELWVLVEIYDMLVTQFGFQPQNGQMSHPLQRIDIIDGEIVRNDLTDHAYFLQLSPANQLDRKISIRLWYDTEKNCTGDRRHWHKLRPDIFMEISDSNQSGLPKRYAIDAKYRRYSEQKNGYRKEREMYNIGSVFDLDLLVTAKMKYHDALGCQSAFIVHSDPSYNAFWGGEPWHNIISTRDSHSNPDGHLDAGHHFGSVAATPRSTGDISRLLKCFLMYHMGIEDVCWHCKKTVASTSIPRKGPQRREVVSQYGVETVARQDEADEEPIGRCYNCPDCHRFWIRTWCQANKDHPIIKIGYETFHAPNPNLLGTYKCPKCGNRLGVPRDHHHHQFAHSTFAQIGR